MERTNGTLKRLILGAAISAAFGGLSAPAFSADTETLLDKLHEKGVLSDQEYEEMRTEARADRREKALKEAQQAEKEEKTKEATASASKLKLPDALNSMELFGDLRLRYEDRIATSPSDVNYDRQRWRYAFRLGVRGDMGDKFFYGLRLDTGSYGRSAWNTFGDDNVGGSSLSSKASQSNKTSDTMSVGLAYIGWKATDWLQVVGGRQPNPLFTTAMVWDPDITPEGLVERLNYHASDRLTLFGVGGQFIYQEFSKPTTLNDSLTVGRQDLMLYAFEAGGQYKFSEDSSAKAAINYYTYVGGQCTTPPFPNAAASTCSPFMVPFTGDGKTLSKNVGVNDLEVVEVPFDYRFPMGGVSGMVFGDYSKNLKGSDRAKHSGLTNPGSDDTAMQIGFSIASSGIPQAANAGVTLGSSAKKGTWEVRTYWQRIGQWALDPNMIDSDFFERTNMEGIFLAGAYSPANGIITTLRYGDAKRYNDTLGTGGANDDSWGLGDSIKKYQLMQFDVTMRF
jgi:hypothetical protein